MSLSEDEQNNDILSIKPPQPQADYSVEEKTRRHRDQRSNYPHGHSSSSKSVKRSKFSKEEKKDLRKGDGRERHESKYEDRHSKESKKEDLRERLERDRRSRKSKDVDLFYENRDVEERKQHELRGGRRNERKQTKHDSDEIEDVRQDYTEGTDLKEVSKRKKQIEYNVASSSPDDNAQASYKHESSKKIAEENQHIQVLSEDVTDDGLYFILFYF